MTTHARLTAIKRLGDYIGDAGHDDPSHTRNQALLDDLRGHGELGKHKDTLFSLAPCDWSFDEIYSSLT